MIPQTGVMATMPLINAIIPVVSAAATTATTGCSQS